MVHGLFILLKNKEMSVQSYNFEKKHPVILV